MNSTKKNCPTSSLEHFERGSILESSRTNLKTEKNKISFLPRQQQPRLIKVVFQYQRRHWPWQHVLVVYTSCHSSAACRRQKAALHEASCGQRDERKGYLENSPFPLKSIISWSFHPPSNIFFPVLDYFFYSCQIHDFLRPYSQLIAMGLRDLCFAPTHNVSRRDKIVL